MIITSFRMVDNKQFYDCEKTKKDFIIFFSFFNIECFFFIFIFLLVKSYVHISVLGLFH